MSAIEPASKNRARHVIALAAGLLALAAFVELPGGVVGDVVMIAVGVVAAFIGHAALLRRGPLRWMAAVGLVLTYLQLFAAVGILVVRFARIAAG